MSSIDALFRRRVETVDVYRPPAVVNGKRAGAAALHLADLAIKRWPMNATPGASMLAALPQLAAARSSHIAIARLPCDVTAGDELRQGARVDKVQGIGRWRSVLVIGIAESAP